jgi:tetratricopeptide (TPR) repeat protein
MSDEIRRLSDELARDPSSLVFVPLGDALRRQGSTDLALKVALRGLERHPYHADGHDLVARIAVDRGDLERAHDEWDMALRLAPQHVGAQKGLGFIYFQQGQLAAAELHLSAAQELDGDDPSIASALNRVKEALASGRTFDVGHSTLEAAGARPNASSPASSVQRPASSVQRPAPVIEPTTPSSVPMLAEDDPRYLFADLLGTVDGTTLLLGADGLVLAGAYLVEGGQDVAQEVGAALSGVSDEARRATRHLEVGDWSSIVFETEHATVSMAPMAGDNLVLLATTRATPLGLARRLLDRCAARAVAFLGGGR